MLASPNYVRFVYDGDGSDTPVAGPAGSAQIEAVFNDYFAGQGLATDPTAFDCRSDAATAARAPTPRWPPRPGRPRSSPCSTPTSPARAWPPTRRRSTAAPT